MLNRFRNALYGTSAASQDDADAPEAIISKRIRSALTRSSSFREDLLSESNFRKLNDNSSNNNSVHLNLKSNQHHHRAERTDSIETARDFSYRTLQNSKPIKVPKFLYTRPDFLQLRTEDEILVSADHQIRPIILPRDISRLPWKSGYAECINAGKSSRNEDQAACHQGRILLTRPSNSPLSMATNYQQDSKNQSQETETNDELYNPHELPWTYFGLFDGHAGPAVAVAAAAQLHKLISIKLNQISDLLVALEFNVEKEDEDNFEYLDCAEKEPDPTGAENCIKNGLLKKPDQCESDSPMKAQSKDSTEFNNNSSEETSVNDQEEEFVNAADEHTTQSKLTDQTNQVESDTKDLAHLSNSEINHKNPKIFQNGQEISNSSESGDQPQQQKPLFMTDEMQYPTLVDVLRNKITVESLIIGALESAFWEMDSMIAQDKNDYKMAGGCTAIVGLFILGKLYVSNAGDSRAIVYKNNQVIPMSFDFTPTSERERILRLGLQHPEFLGSDFTHLEFLKRPMRKDIGKQMLYKDAYMTGWSMKTITRDDLKFPLVWGEGKRSRVLATIGVTRGFGDHELRALYGSVHIKPFLTPEPEVKVLPLEHDSDLSAEDVLIIGTDGLWDVTSNQEAATIVRNSFDRFPDNEESRSKYRYITAAQDLVIHSRGETKNWSTVWRTDDDKLASLDDIAVFVIPLKQYRDDYLEWKKCRLSASQGRVIFYENEEAQDEIG